MEESLGDLWMGHLALRNSYKSEMSLGMPIHSFHIADGSLLDTGEKRTEHFRERNHLQTDKEVTAL